MHRILIVEDDPAIMAVLRALLSSEGFRLAEAGTAARGHLEARSHKPDLLLVDLGLPDRDGVTLIRQVRAWSPMPIIVLSARTAEEQKIAALNAGADDYVTKPFSAPELLARVRAALRRAAQVGEQGPLLRLGQVRVDTARRTAWNGTQELRLTPLEYRVLECLARRAGFVVTQRQLIQEAWGPHQAGDASGLRVCIRNLRAKIEPDPHRPKYVLTDVGVGYRLRPDEGTDST